MPVNLGTLGKFQAPYGKPPMNSSPKEEKTIYVVNAKL